jgi:hypothetical protein
MKFNLIYRSPVLIFIAFFMAISFSASGQKSVPLANTRFNQLLTTAEAGTLRTQLLKLPGATVGRKGVAETQTGTFNKKAVTVEIASQFISTNDGEVEQVTILVNEGGQAKTISLFQNVNTGAFGGLKGGILESYGQMATDYASCLFGSENSPASCDKCLDQITDCSNSNVAISTACLTARLLNPVGACVRCGVFSLAQVITCYFGLYV